MNAFDNQEWESLEAYETPAMGEWETGPAGEFGNQEQFLDGILGALTGSEMESSPNEMEQAQELMEITSEEELEQFLGDLVKGAAKAVGGFIRSPVGKALGGALKSVAKTALPVAAGALGNFIVPGVGGAIGSKLGSMATKLFEVELEGMNEAEAEFEVARRYVRFANAAARNAARAPAGAPPRAVARAAIISAARRHAPGLVRTSRGPGQRPRIRPRRSPAYRGGVSGGPYVGDGATVDAGPEWTDDDAGYGPQYPVGSNGNGYAEGRWIRRGRKIVLLGV